MGLPFSSDSPKLDDSQSHRKQVHSLSHSEPAIYSVLIDTQRINLFGPTRRPTLVLIDIQYLWEETVELSFFMYLCKFWAIAENLLLVCSILWSCSLSPQKENQNLLSLNEYASHTVHTLSQYHSKLGHSLNKSLRKILLLNEKYKKKKAYFISISMSAAVIYIKTTTSRKKLYSSAIKTEKNWPS